MGMPLKWLVGVLIKASIIGKSLIRGTLIGARRDTSASDVEPTKVDLRIRLLRRARRQSGHALEMRPLWFEALGSSGEATVTRKSSSADFYVEAHRCARSAWPTSGCSSGSPRARTNMLQRVVTT